MTLEAEFNRLKNDRVNLKSKKMAALIDPSLFPDTGQSVEEERALHRDWQSFGRQMIDYAAADIMQQLFPIGKAFFKIDMPQEFQEAVAGQLHIQPSDIPGTLVDEAKRAAGMMQWRGNFARVTWGIKVLLTTGNVLLCKRLDGAMTAYTTRDYAIKRDGSGLPLVLVLRERHARRALPEAIQAQLKPPKEGPEAHMETVDFYTKVVWDYGHLTKKSNARGVIELNRGAMCRITQGCDSWESQEILVREELCPYLPVVVDLVPGESYGRGLVEANAGDFARYSELSRALTIYEIAASKVVFGVPNGAAADIDELNSAETGEYVWGDPKAIAAIEAGDAQKIMSLRQELQDLETRLARTFGYGGNMRQAERVTAEEVSLNAQQSDITKGGLYSHLSYSIHGPLAMLFLNDINAPLVVMMLTSGSEVKILTGIPALGQSAEVQALLRAAQTATMIYQGLGQMSQAYSPDKIANLCLLAEGFNPATIHRSEEELQAMQQAQQQALPTQGQNPQNYVSAVQGTLQNG